MQSFDSSHLLQHILKYEATWPPPAVPLPPDLQKESDEKLLELIRGGTSSSQRKNAFSELYNRYYLDVWRVIKSKVFSEEDAKDIFAEVWAVAVSKLGTFDWQEDKSPKAWLITTAKYKRLEFIRKITKDDTIALNDDDIYSQALNFLETELQLDETSSLAAPPPAVRAEADKLLMKAVSQLKPKPRRIILLTYFKRKNATEIGQILGMKPGTVRVDHKRALEKLRSLLISGVK